MNSVQALRKLAGVFAPPRPYADFPPSRILAASAEKSLSFETMQIPSHGFLYRNSIASITSAMSATFFPETLLTCGLATTPYSRCAFAHPPSDAKQLTIPYALRAMGIPIAYTFLKISPAPA